MRRLFEFQTDYRDIVLDLKDVGAVDREVMRFFISCEAEGMQWQHSRDFDAARMA